VTPQMIARNALSGQMTPLDALVRIAGMEAYPEGDPYYDINGVLKYRPVYRSPHAYCTPAITDEVVERCWWAYASSTGSHFQTIRAALEEFVRQTRPHEILRAAEQTATRIGPQLCSICGQPDEPACTCHVEAANRAAVYVQTADREAGEVAFGNGEPLDPRKSMEWKDGWVSAAERA